MIPIRREWSAMKRLALLSPALAAPAVDDYATGNPVVFITDLAKPLKQLQVSFTPVQTGSGDPSPVNQRPIVPWEGLDIYHTGGNLFDKTQTFTDGKYLDQTGNEQTSSNWKITDYIPVEGEVFRLCNVFGNSPSICLYDENKSFVKGKKYGHSGTIQSTTDVVIESEATVKFCRFSLYKVDGLDDIVRLEAGAEHPVAFPEPVYGGHVDLATGEIWGTYEILNLSTVLFYAVRAGFFASYANVPEYLDRSLFVCNSYKVVSYTYWDEMPNKSIMGITPGNTIRIRDDDIEDAASLKARLIELGAKLAYQLVTPVLLGTIPPETIRSLKGTNTIWSDANGQISVVFQKKK